MDSYKAGIEENAKMIMTSFNIVDEVAVTINKIHLYEKFVYHKVGYADWRKGRFYLMEKISY